MSDEEEFFDSPADAEARCRELEQDSDSTWIAYPAQGRWRIAETNLPQTAPDGTATEAKPRPPEADDPRSGGARDVPGYLG